jgi:hypothetical protein
MNDDAGQIDFYFAPEIEQALVATVWQHPECFELVKAELDFDVHILSPPLRKILQAIELVYGDVGYDLDWACVVDGVRELGALEEVGGLQGLNTVFTDNNRYPYGKCGFSEGAGPLVRFYIKCLKTYALNRQSDPSEQVPLFVGGKGWLKPNKNRRGDKSPHMTGPIVLQGINFSMSAWKQADGSFTLSLRPEDK